MKAPRIVLPPSKPSAPVVELATTPQVISPRTISYLCNPSLGAGPSLVRPPHATGSEGEDRQSDPCMAFGPEGSIGGAVLLSPRLGITGTSSSHAQGLSPHGGGGGNRPGTSLSPMSQSSSELLLARSSCSPFGSSPSPSPSDLGGSCFAGSPSDTGSLSLHPSLSSLSSSDNKGDPSIRRRGASLLDDSEATSPRVVPPFSSSTHFRGSFSASQQRPTRAPAVPRASSFKDPRPRGAASASPSAPSSAPQDSHPRAPRPVFSGGDLLLPKLPEVAVAGQPPRLLTPEAPAGAGADLSPGVVLPEPCTPRGNQTRIATGSLGFRSEAGRSARSLWSASISSSQGESVAGSSRSLPSLDGCELFDHFVDTGRATAMGMPTGSAQRKPPVASGAVRNSLSRHSLSKSGLPKDSLSLGHASSQDAKVEASLGCESEPAAEAGPVGSTESSGSLSPGERNSNGEAGRRRSPFPEHTSPCATPREHSTGPRAMSRVMSSESSGLSKKEGPGEGVGGRERERERQSEAAQAMAMAMAMAPDAVYRSPGRARRSFSRSVDFNEMGSASDPLEECCEREPDSGSGRGREREKEREDGSEGSQGEGSVDSPMGLRVPRLPSLSRLRLSSREPEDASGMPSRPPCKIPPPLRTSVHTQAASGVPHSAPISCGPGFGVGGGLGGLGSSCLGGSPGKLTRRMSGPASLKRKRPPMLDIPIKDAFTSSPTSTPPPFLVDEAREIKEVSGDGPGFAVLCKRGKRRDNMEDRYQAVQGLGGIPGLNFYGVLDGHGGTAAAEFGAKQLHLSLLESLKKRSMEDTEAAMVDAFVNTDKSFLAQNRPSGASCVTCVATPAGVFVAHAGDCRAVLSRGGVPVVLTEDHKASREDERARIEALGGHVDDFTGTWRVQGIMAVTRGLGDSHLKEYITSVPETRRVSLETNDDFIVLASDGLWDVVTSEEAVSTVSSILFPPARAPGSDAADDSLVSQLQFLISPKAHHASTPRAPANRRGERRFSYSGELPLANLPGLCLEGTAEHSGPDKGAEREDGPEDGERLRVACKKLTELAISKGSYDDISVMVITSGALQTP